MREKAEGRNKDEFYFGMINSRTQVSLELSWLSYVGCWNWLLTCYLGCQFQKGVHVQSRGNESLPMDLVKVLKTQDAGYIRTQRAIEESVGLSSVLHSFHQYSYELLGILASTTITTTN